MTVKRFVLFICIFILTASFTVAEEQYDPQFTLQALNIAIVSIQKIISSENKVVLTQEYDNIINNLQIANIKSDYEITSLYEELMKVISSKLIRKEEKERLKAKYEKKEKRQVIEALSGIRAYGGNVYSWLASLVTSCVSQYFSYRNANEELKDSLDDDSWQLKKEELTDINEIRQKLLTSSWNLLRKYRIPNENRLTEKVLENYYKGITNSDAEARLRIIKRQEQYFQAYPPYWIDRANAADLVGNNEEVKRCYEKFDEVWRPILGKDVYKSTALKYRLKEELLKKSKADKTKIEKYLEELKKYSEDDDWITNILIGITYFKIGEKDKAIDSVLANDDFKYETEISKPLVEEMKTGKLDNFDFLLKCSNCKGKGYIETNGTYTCSKCDGRGKKLLFCFPSFNPSVLPCSKCNGTGKFTINKLIWCEKCNGTGNIDKKCSMCKGSGRVEVAGKTSSCPRCEYIELLKKIQSIRETPTIWE